MIDRIKSRLAVLDPEYIEIQDDSALHAGHAGARSGGGHFRLSIVAAVFESKSTVARHRMIYDALGDLMKTEIHALAIRAHSHAEVARSTNPKDQH